MKKIISIIIISLIAITIGGGAGYYYFFMRTPKEPVVEIKEEKQFQLDPIVVNLANKDAFRYLKVQYVLSYYEDKKVEPEKWLAENVHKIRDLIIVKVREMSLFDLVETEAPNNLKEAIRDGINEIAGEDIVVDIYTTDYIIN